MITLYIQGQLQEGWTTLQIQGERENDLANAVASTLSRLELEIRLAREDEEPVRLEEFDWEEME